MSIRLHSPSVGSGSVSSGDVLVLKVHLSENDAASYKSFKFTAKMKVAEAIDHIKVKTAAASSDKYGLFVNYEEKSGPSAGFWLDPDKTLGHYSLTHKTSIEFKSMVMPISISDLQEDMTKKIKLDLTALVKDVIENICHRFDIDDASEFGLQVRRTSKKEPFPFQSTFQ